LEQRLQKLIAAAGMCSRRTAEIWISSGRVAVNGETAVIGQSADAERDEILIDGKPLKKAERSVYLMLNKPRGYVCTLSDEKGRPTVAQLVADCGARVVPAGRLDFDSEGLLLLSNDGEWVQRITHPSHEIDKVYHVTVAGEPAALAEAAAKLSSMKELDGERIRRAQTRVLRMGRETAELRITIHEGKNRQIRRMCAACGLHVKRLRRIAEHKLELGSLPAGKWRFLTEEEVRGFQE
jgi:23S rRNA pseudouridine2605 synthase